MTVVVIVSLAVVGFVAGGNFIVASDAFVEADVAVVLSGGEEVRTLAARDLYRSGRVRRIVLISEPPRDPIIEAELVALGVVVPSEIPFAERILVASGVPRSAFEFVPEPQDGTINEARAVKRFLAAKPAKRVAIVTSKFASRRACLIFLIVLDGREVYCAPSPHDPFRPGGWWRHPRNALNVVMEYQKLAANLVMLAVTGR